MKTLPEFLRNPKGTPFFYLKTEYKKGYKLTNSSSKNIIIMFIYLTINMSENQIFKELDIEHKRDYMWRLFAPRVENIKD